MYAMCAALALASCNDRSNPPSGHRITIVTALPLFQDISSPQEYINGPDQRAAIIRSLAKTNRLVPLAHVDAGALKGSILIVAQPRVLGGDELVAIDAYVRDGGRALVFSDPELVWPSDLPLGDPRRPPPIGLLDPLLDHWGLRLESPPITDSGPDELITYGNASVRVAWAGRWTSKTAACRIESAGHIAECRIGKGKVLLVADADLLDERLWEDRGSGNEAAIFAMLSRVATP